MELTAQELRIGNLVQIVKYWKDFYDENLDFCDERQLSY